MTTPASTDLHKPRRKRSALDARAMASIDRLPPHSLEAEVGVLGCILLLPSECLPKCIEKFKPGAPVFYDLKNQTIYTALVEMSEAKMAIDVITLHQWLKDRNLLEGVGGLDYVAPLPDKVASSANLDFYAGIVWDKYILRRCLRTATEMIAEVYENESDVESLIDGFETAVLAIGQERVSTKTSDIKTLANEAINTLEKWHSNQGALLGLSTGFLDLDRMTAGLMGGDMIVIAARPSCGKTSIAMNMAEAVAVEQRLPVGVFSLEMSSASLVLRMICSRARVNVRSLREGFFSERDFPKLTTAAGKLANSPLHIDDTPGLSILQLRAKARRMWQQHGIKLFVIDYLQLLHATSRKAQENRQQEIAEISSGVKALAKELDVPVIVLAQLNRELEKRGENAKPRMSDLRESGAIEQDADLIGLLYKPDSDEENEGKDCIRINLLIAKQRNGPTGDVNLTFFKSHTRFESAAKIAPEDVPAE